jgi:hypothetical protein
MEGKQCMNDLFDAPLFELLKVLKIYVNAIKRNDVVELSKFKQKHAEIFTDEFGDYIREWLETFGISSELLTKLHNNESISEFIKLENNVRESIH